MVTARQIIRLLILAPLSVVAAAFVALVIEHAVPSAWFEVWAGWLVAAITWMAGLVVVPWFAWTGGIAAGLSLGLWLDTWLRRRESPERPKIDRTALAARADALASEINELVGRHEAEMAHAWHEDTIEMVTSLEGITKTIPMRDRSRSADEVLIRGFTAHRNEFWDIVHQAQKCVSLNGNGMWHLSHGIRGTSDVKKVPMILSAIAVQLRFDEPIVPHDNRKKPPHDGSRGTV